jgi:hypothetical protein
MPNIVLVRLTPRFACILKYKCDSFAHVRVGGKKMIVNHTYCPLLLCKYHRGKKYKFDLDLISAFDDLQHLRLAQRISMSSQLGHGNRPIYIVIAITYTIVCTFFILGKFHLIFIYLYGALG